MSWKGTLLLLITAGLALGYLLFSERTRTHPPQEPLLGIDPSIASEIQIQEGDSLFSLIKTNGLWIIRTNLDNESNQADRANPQLIGSLLETAADITPLDILRSSELKGKCTLESLGLKKRNRSISILADKKVTLWIGTEGAAPASIYTRLNSGKTIYLISGKIASLAFRPAQEYRDPRLTALGSDHLSEISITKGAAMQQLHLQKEANHGWMLLTPVSAKGDDTAVTAWIDTVLGSQITRWMPEGTDSTSCGLDTPAAIITLLDEGSTTPLVITVGSPVPDVPGNTFVHCSDRPGICMVGGTLNQFLATTPQSLRSKKIKQVEFDTVDRIETDGYYIKRKSKSDDWMESTPDYKVISGDRMRQWYDQLQGLSASGFEAATPEHLNQRGLGTNGQQSPSATNHQMTIRLIATLSENTAQENEGETLLAEYNFGLVTNGEVALHEGDSPELLILPASSVEFLKSFPEQAAKP